jgi:hypothetical protein
MSMREIAIRLPRTRLGELASEQFKDMALGGQFWLTAFTLLAALLLGGGTRSGFLSDALLQLLAIPLLLLSASRLGDLFWRHRAKLRQVRAELIFCLALVLVPLIQLVPLPPALWTLLPHRGPLIASFDGLGQGLGHGLPWLPISVSPNATWLSVVALLPTLAVFFGTVLLGYRERRLLSLAVVAFGIVSAFLGLLQIAQGPASRLRFFAATNLTEAVGFFANRNHFAAFLYVVLLFAAVWAIDVGFAVGPLHRDHHGKFFGHRHPARGRGHGALARRHDADHDQPGRRLWSGADGSAAAQFERDAFEFPVRGRGNGLHIGRAIRALSDFGTVQCRSAGRRTAWAYMPFGAGMGTFVPVYGMFERPQDLFAHAYVNHAHDDILELCLETGIFGLTLMVAFVAWFVSRAARIWRRASVRGNEFDRSLARAATIAVALIVTHSFLDYPLRTAAMTAILAFACGLMVETLGADDRAKQRQVRASRDTAMQGAAPRATAVSVTVASPPAIAPDQEPAPSHDPPRPRPARWGDGVEWPEAWRGPGTSLKKTSGPAPTPPPDADKK